jgi:dipeptidyl aminopeptidase/acylaminoacyl peptidase
VVDQYSSIQAWVANPPRLIIWKRVADANVLESLPISADGTKVTGGPQKLISSTDPLLNVSIAWDGRMVLSVSTTRGHTWGLPIDASGHPAGAPRQITAGSEGEYGPALSRDGRKLVFMSQRANGQRLLYEDLTTGHQKEISTDESGFWHGVFNKDGSGVIAAHNEAIHYLPLSGGPPKKIWELPKGAVRLWDWSPDGKTLLLYTNNPRPGVVQQLNLGSLSLTPFLDEPDLDTWQANFSHDGRWVVFNATNQAFSTSSRIYIAPFRKGPVARSEWIPIADGEWDDKPRFSPDDKMIFFLKGNVNEPHSLWSQRLNAMMQPDGKPVAVYSAPDSRRVITWDDISAGSGLIVFMQAEPTGNIWLAEPVKGAMKY